MLSPCLLCGLILHPLLSSPLPSLSVHPLCLRFLRCLSSASSCQNHCISIILSVSDFSNSEHAKTFLSLHGSSYQRCSQLLFRSRRAVHTSTGLQVNVGTLLKSSSSPSSSCCSPSLSLGQSRPTGGKA